MLHQKASCRVGDTPAITKLSSGMILRLLLMIASLEPISPRSLLNKQLLLKRS